MTDEPLNDAPDAGKTAQSYSDVVEIKERSKIEMMELRKAWRSELEEMSAQDRIEYEKKFWAPFRKIASEFGRSKRLILTPTEDEK